MAAKTSNFILSFNMFCDLIDQIINFNKEFVAQKDYEKYLTSKTHPLIPMDIVVRGFIIDSEIGAIER